MLPVQDEFQALRFVETNAIDVSRLIVEDMARFQQALNESLAQKQGDSWLYGLVAEDATHHEKIADYCDSIDKTIYRVTRIIRGLKSLARQNHDTSPQRVNLKNRDAAMLGSKFQARQDTLPSKSLSPILATASPIMC